jgi:hypothetical protein
MKGEEEEEERIYSQRVRLPNRMTFVSIATEKDIGNILLNV